MNLTDNVEYFFNPKSIHTFIKKGRYFLFCVDSLSIFELNKTAYQIFNSFPPINLNNFIKRQNNSKIEFKQTLEELLNWGLLSKKPVYSFRECSLKRNVQTNKDKNLTGIHLVISHDCNLRCKYCYAQYGKFGVEYKQRFMSNYIAIRSIDFYLENRASEKEQPWIFFDGGEPLLNFELIKFVVKHLRDRVRDANYSLITNGTLMTAEKAKWLIENGVKVTFSIDGTKQIHDKNRVYKNGKGSYENTLKGINVFKKLGKNGISVKTSIPKGENFMKCIHHIWNLGIKSVFADCTSESYFIETKEFKMDRVDHESFFKEWELLSLEILSQLIEEGASPFIHLAYVYLESLIKRRVTLRGCSIGKNVSITPDGKIYLCNGLTGYSDYAIGDIFKGIEKKYWISFQKIYKDYLHKCDNCWARNICVAGCIAQSIKYEELDDYYEPSRLCEFNRKAIETIIYIYYKLREYKPELLNKI